MRKLQSQGVHHITLVGADRADVDRLLGGRARDAVRVRAAEPRQRAREPPLLRPGRRAPDHGLHQRGARGRSRPAPPTDPGCVHHIAFSVSQATFNQAVERLDERGIRHSGVKDRGFMDSIYFEDPLGLLIELAVVPVRAAGRLHARRGAARGAQAPRRARRLRHRPDPPRRRDRGASSRARASRSPRTARRRIRTDRSRPRDLEDTSGRQHAEHPEAERQQPDRPDLRPRRRARLRGDRRLGQERPRPSSSPRTRPT